MGFLSDREILIIDDASDIRTLVNRILANEGARVSQADHIDLGIQLADEKTPHLIIVDLMMPGKTGFDFLTHRQNSPTLKNIPTMVLSGQNDYESISRAVSLGADDYLLKPFRAPLLSRKVRNLLRIGSTLTRRFSPGEATVEVTLPSEIASLNEGGYSLESSVRLGPEIIVKIESTLLTDAGLADVTQRSSRHASTYVRPGCFLNQIHFIGMNDEATKSLRAYVRGKSK